MKNIEDVENYLNFDKSRPSLGEAPRDVFKRRAPWYYECADFDLLPAPGASSEADFRSAAFLVPGSLLSKKWCDPANTLQTHNPM